VPKHLKKNTKDYSEMGKAAKERKTIVWKNQTNFVWKNQICLEKPDKRGPEISRATPAPPLQTPR